MEISGSNSDIGSAIEVVDCATDGPPQEIAFNARYLADVLKLADRVKVELKPGVAPAKLTLIGDDNWVGVVTPIRAM